MSDAEIDEQTQLPSGFARGNVVAILELGSTRLASLEERCTEDVEGAVCAYGADMGRYLTSVVRSEWLREPVRNVRGRPGLFQVTVPRSAIPDGWTLPTTAGDTEL